MAAPRHASVAGHVIEGDRLDLERVYREQYRPLVGFILKRLGDRGRSEELAQEVFVRAIQHRPDNPRAWIYTVAANLVRDEGRRIGVRRRHLRVVTVEDQQQEPPAHDQPDERLERREQQQRIQHALAALSERDREALLLKEEGLSYAEIAERLELSPGSMGTTMARARARLTAAWERGASEARQSIAGEGHDDVAR